MSTSSILIKRSIIKNYFKEVKHEDYLFKCELLKGGNLSLKNFDTFVYYRISKIIDLQINFLIINLWKINKFYKLNLVENLKSIISISIIH